MDVLTIVLSARKQELWLYYALMATIGSVSRGYVTYWLARKGGKETLERKFPPWRLEKVYRIFGRWGFGAIAIAALLRPPVPMVPFLFAAGAMQYSVENSWWRSRSAGLSDIPSWRSWRPIMDGKCSRSCRATWTSGPHHRYRADCSGNRGSPSHSRKETQ